MGHEYKGLKPVKTKTYDGNGGRNNPLCNNEIV